MKVTFQIYYDDNAKTFSHKYAKYYSLKNIILFKLLLYIKFKYVINKAHKKFFCVNSKSTIKMSEKSNKKKFKFTVLLYNMIKIFNKKMTQHMKSQTQANKVSLSSY